MEIQERISQIIAHYNLNKNSFSKKIGLRNNTTIENILGKRKTKPSYDIMHKIVMAFPNINANWLLTGKGNMLLNEENKVDDTTPLLEAKDKIIALQQEKMIMLEQQETKFVEIIQEALKPHFKTIPDNIIKLIDRINKE